MAKINDKNDYKQKFINIAKNIKEENIFLFNKRMMEIHGANVNLARAIPDVRDGLTQ